MQLSRQEAVEALRHTKGDVHKAFVNELAAMHLNVSLMDNLVLAYAAHRYCNLRANRGVLTWQITRTWHRYHIMQSTVLNTPLL